VNTTIYMYYGNSTMTSRQNPAGVWNSFYHGVWHLKQLTGSVIDSTSYSTSGTVSGTVNRTAIGQINGAFDFGFNGMINFGDPSNLDMGTSSFSISFWIKFEGSTGGFQLPVYKGATTEFDIGYDFESMPDESGGALTFRISDGNGNLGESDGLFFVHNNWMHVTGVVNRTADTISIFKDGLEVGTPNSIAGIGTLNNNHNFLASYNIYSINGLLDEIRISKTPLSVDWIKTEYYNQYDPDSSDPLEFGDKEIIQITASDSSGIFQVLIELEGSNYSMTNIGGELWQYDSWIPSIIGNYTYTIHIQDNLKNWNSTTNAIEVIDTTPPNFSNLEESSNPLELGQMEIIQIDVNDLAGVAQVMIEFEGLNHSMMNIGENTWQYSSWTPENWTIYQYKIYMEDNNGNWNSTTGNVTVCDTLTPPSPILNNPPSGDYTGNIVFDWWDGSDPSGISYYILIISNEDNPLITSGYVYFFNITVSYYELTDTLPSGKYYYFLAQIDGAGHQSSYTMGSFTININQNDNFMIYLVIIITLTSVLGSVTGIVIIRKRSQRKLRVPRKKIPLKFTLSHIKEISSKYSEGREIEDLIIKKQTAQDTIREELLDKMDQQPNIEEIKNIGEQLFDDGAYLEAIKQFELAKEISSKIGREEDVTLFSGLIDGINSLIKEREVRIEALNKEKIDGTSLKIFEFYLDVINISKKLRDIDAVSMFKSEMMNFFNANKYKLIEIQKSRVNLEEQAESLSSAGQYEKAIQEFERCEQISELLMNFNKNERIIIDKFKNKKAECQQKLTKNKVKL
ncbi:MAG: LamG-like jellyroll fold domain-containing protein, partial [Candidatus Heimdallarchaeota archaeon]